MKGDPKVIALLNELLKAELTAINQYFLHAEMCENWGYERLAKLIKKESIEEMTHAEKLMERILYLDGFFLDQLRQPFIAPVFTHLGVQEVLVDRGQLRLSQLVQQSNDFGIDFHFASRNSGMNTTQRKQT